MKSKSFHIITLGCKVNQYESEALRQSWLAAGHLELSGPAGADLVLINSCAITARAVSDLRAMARRARRLAPAAEILVTGCAAQALPQELVELPVNGLVPQSDKITLLRYLDETLPGPVDPADPADPVEAAVQPTGPESTEPSSPASPAELASPAEPAELKTGATPGLFPPFSISDYARTRAVLKIHDGCSQHCTYCIVPQGRGPSVSRPWPEILAEAGRLVEAGFREIVLNGVNLRQYGGDLPGGEDFWSLLLRLEAAFAAEFAGPYPPGEPRLRFRISSLEPGQLDHKALETLAACRLVAPQLHLSLQSGSPEVLKKMGRGHYNPAKLPGWLAELRRIWPRFGLGADFITGFPGESEAQFAETLALAEDLPLTYAHVFPYSRRPGTVAARLTGQLPQEVKKERAARLRALLAAKKQAFLREQLKLETVWLVAEEGKPGQGVNEFYSDCRLLPDAQAAGTAASPDTVPDFGSSAPAPARALRPARPLAVQGEFLLVENCRQYNSD